MKSISRRAWLSKVAGAIAAGYLFDGCSQNVSKTTGCSLGYGTYGLPGYSLEEAVKLVSAIGYDSVEPVCMPGYHGDPATVSKTQRKTLRVLLNDLGLHLGALMNLPRPSIKAVDQEASLESMKQMLELAHDLSGETSPLIQGVLGGGAWEEKKTLFRDQVGQWQELAAEVGITLAVKPHRSHAMSKPSDGIWLIEELGNSPFLRLVYDYSHYAFRGLSIEETVAEALPYTAYVVMKDAVEQNGKVGFGLPGAAGTMDHAKALRLFYQGGYRGEVCCEVSSQIWRAEDFDPEKAARLCHDNLDKVFVEANVPRA